MHWDTLKQGNDSTVRGDGGSRVCEVRAGTTSPMPEHKGFYATVTVRDPPNHTSSLRVKYMSLLQNHEFPSIVNDKGLYFTMVTYLRLKSLQEFLRVDILHY